MKEDEYFTINKSSKGVYKEKGSKFIAHAIPVENEEEIKEKIEEIKNQYHDARHHCYAYQTGIQQPNFRMNDDGEPSSTAGKPIYGQIQSYNITNVLIVVVRYFGGIKLGTSGLIRAYKTATEEALKKNRIIKKTITRKLRIEFEYGAMNEVMKLLHELNIEPKDKEFTDKCVFIFDVRKSLTDNTISRFKLIKNLKAEETGN